jgi:two-component system, LuxR family, response regulator FixJ
MSANPSAAGGRGRLLVAEDHAALLKSLMTILRQAGFLVTGAKSGDEARDLLDDRAFDVLLADINMPGNARLELVSAARAANVDVDVILMTGEPSVASAVGALREGAFDYITKPISPETLLLSIDRAMEKRRTRVSPPDPLGKLEPDDLARLSLREQQIARLLALGSSAKDVATRLELSPNTVRNHMKSVFAKLRVHSQVELLVLLQRPSK